MRRIALLVCLLSAYSFGQGGAATGIPTITNTRGEPVPYATVAVCVGYPGSVPSTPCGTSTLATIATDLTLTTSCTNNLTPPGPISGIGCSNPGKSDGLGNIVAFATPGLYWCQYSGGSIIQPVVVPCFFANGSGGGIPFACASAVNGSIVGMTSPTTSSCDPNGITDFIGHWTSQSYRATGTHNGTVELTGGLADPANPPDTNSVALLAPLTVPTPYYLRPPASTGTIGQCLQLLTQDSGTNGIIDALQWATCAAGAGTVTSFSAGNLSPLFTTSVATATSTPALTFSLTNAAANTVFGNFTGSSGAPSYNAISACGDSTHALAWTAGTGFTCQAISAGSAVSITATSPVVVTPTPITGTGVVSCPTCVAYTQASNPSAPTLTPNTPGSTAYSYAVVGCEDVNCAFHSAMSGITSTSTGNANLATGTMKLTAYADTLYGYRFYKICRTASSGTPNSIGVIATGAGKIFIDNGLVGDGTTCASTYAANTTVLDQHCLASSLPAALNVMPGSPCGVDAPPTSPNAVNDELTTQLGNPADANDGVWSWVNQGSATATWSGGTVLLKSDTTASSNMEMLAQSTALPVTPYTFTAYVDLMGPTAAGGCALGFRESSTGKMATMIIFEDEPLDGTAANGGTVVGALNWTSPTANSSVHLVSYKSDGYYLKLQNTGTNIVFSWSPSGDGVNFTQLATEAVGTPFTTAPNQLVLAVNSATTAAACTFDYVRRTQ